MDAAFEFGADDMNTEDEVIEISCEPSELGAVRDGLVSKGYNILSAEADMIPSTYTTLTDEEHLKKMRLLLEHLEDNDDVQNVYHNWENADE
jgi:transcriptional/translational regulatory protein YebC/TACO1